MTVGVVVGVRGWAPYLAEALDCVLAEEPAEVVVVDDASDDPLVLHPDHVARGVRLVRRDDRGGPGAARNTGIAALSEVVDMVAFCDADDAWEPGSLGLRLAALNAAPWVAGAFGRARIVGPDGRATGERWPEPLGGVLDDVAALYLDNPVLTSSVVVRRASFAGFDESFALAEDWEAWLRLVRGGAALVFVAEAVVRYRRHAGSETARLLELARAQRRLHEVHAGAVTPSHVEQAAARDRAGEAEGLLRAGRYAEARALLPAGRRRTLLALPLARGHAGRKDPYRR